MKKLLAMICLVLTYFSNPTFVLAASNPTISVGPSKIQLDSNTPIGISVGLGSDPAKNGYQVFMDQNQNTQRLHIFTINIDCSAGCKLSTTSPNIDPSQTVFNGNTLNITLPIVLSKSLTCGDYTVSIKTNDNSVPVSSSTLTVEDPNNPCQKTNNTQPAGPEFKNPDAFTNALKGIFSSDTVNLQFSNLGDFISKLLDIVYALATGLAFIYLFWGAFQYLLSGGDKQGIANARQRVIYALIGLMIIMVAYALTQFLGKIFAPNVSSPVPFSLLGIQTVYAYDPSPLSPVPLSQTYGFGHFNTVGEVISTILPILFSIATLVVVFYFLIAAIQILLSGGNKEAVGKARTRITHSIIGFVALMLVFLVFQYLLQFFGVDFHIL